VQALPAERRGVPPGVSASPARPLYGSHIPSQQPRVSLTSEIYITKSCAAAGTSNFQLYQNLVGVVAAIV
jgi:hypothetical protein